MSRITPRALQCYGNVFFFFSEKYFIYLPKYIFFLPKYFFFRWACRGGLTDVAMRMLDIGGIDVNKVDGKYSTTPLLQACTQGLEEVAVRLLTTYGQDLIVT